MIPLQSKNKIIHLFGWEKKFCPPFIKFVHEHFGDAEHCYIIYGMINDGPIPNGSNVIHYPSLLKNLPELLRHIRKARKVILHGLFGFHLYYALMLQPWLLKKCYWTIWGGDLYIHNAAKKDWRFWKNEIIRRFVISRIGNFITHIKGDYELARQWYGAKGQWHECFMYPSNLFREPPDQITEHEGVNILLGNSAAPSNNHKEILDRLSLYAGQTITIYCPLSYSDQVYAQELSEYGKSIFGDKFVALRDFMQLEQYLSLLAKIDIAIFNHNRQQGMGNTTSLLGMGKKVYMRKEVTPYEMFENLGVKVFSVAEIDLKKINCGDSSLNIGIIKKYFSLDCLVAQWSKICD